MIDVYIDKISMLILGLIRESISFPTPTPQVSSVTVLGRNSPIRFNETFGRISYEPRNFEIVLTMLSSRKDFIEKLGYLTNRFLGKVCRITLSETPELFYVGTLQIENEYNADLHKGTIKLTCDDGDAYCYHASPTVVEITGSGTVTLNNDYMPTVPTVTTTAETTLSWQVGNDQFTKTISAGTWEFPELELVCGQNRVAVVSSGKTTFTYTEGRL